MFLLDLATDNLPQSPAISRLRARLGRPRGQRLAALHEPVPVEEEPHFLAEESHEHGLLLRRDLLKLLVELVDLSLLIGLWNLDLQSERRAAAQRGVCGSRIVACAEAVRGAGGACITEHAGRRTQPHTDQI